MTLIWYEGQTKRREYSLCHIRSEMAADRLFMTSYDRSSLLFIYKTVGPDNIATRYNNSLHRYPVHRTTIIVLSNATSKFPTTMLTFACERGTEQ